MCGDVEETIDDELFELFLERARTYGVSPEGDRHEAPAPLADEIARKNYMNSLFKAGLTRSLNDAADLPRGERMDALAGQAIVFARLAGFLAGQLPPQADLFRTIVGSMFDGHGEPAS